MTERTEKFDFIFYTACMLFLAGLVIACLFVFMAPWLNSITGLEGWWADLNWKAKAFLLLTWAGFMVKAAAQLVKRHRSPAH